MNLDELHTIGEETKTYGDWMEEAGVKRTTVDARMRSGMSFLDAITKPVRKFNPPKFVAFGMEPKTVDELYRDKRCIVHKSTLRSRLRVGMNPELAMTTPPMGTIELSSPEDTQPVDQSVKKRGRPEVVDVFMIFGSDLINYVRNEEWDRAGSENPSELGSFQHVRFDSEEKAAAYRLGIAHSLKAGDYMETNNSVFQRLHNWHPLDGVNSKICEAIQSLKVGEIDRSIKILRCTVKLVEGLKVDL